MPASRSDPTACARRPAQARRRRQDVPRDFVLRPSIILRWSAVGCPPACRGIPPRARIVHTRPNQPPARACQVPGPPAPWLPGARPARTLGTRCPAHQPNPAGARPPLPARPPPPPALTCRRCTERRACRVHIGQLNGGPRRAPPGAVASSAWLGPVQHSARCGPARLGASRPTALTCPICTERRACRVHIGQLNGGGRGEGSQPRFSSWPGRPRCSS